MSWNALKKSRHGRWVGAGILILVVGIAALFALPLVNPGGIDPSAEKWVSVGIGADAGGTLTALGSGGGDQVEISATGRRIGSTVDSFYFASRLLQPGGRDCRKT